MIKSKEFKSFSLLSYPRQTAKAAPPTPPIPPTHDIPVSAGMPASLSKNLILINPTPTPILAFNDIKQESIQ
jgi:hypothetical protein